MASRASRSLQGPAGPPGAGFRRFLLQVLGNLQNFQRLQSGTPWPQGPRPANLLQPGVKTCARTPLRGHRNTGSVLVGLLRWVLGIPMKGKINVHCFPMYGKRSEGLYTSTLHRLLPLSYPVRVYRLTCIFSV